MDLVGNDSGGGIAQIFAALHPERVRSLTLTDCDAHDNWPPEAFKPFLAMAAARRPARHARGDAGGQERLSVAAGARAGVRASGARDRRRPSTRICGRSSRTEQRTRDLERFLAAFDSTHTLAIEARLKTLKAPTLIVWGTDDVYFDVKWSHWLADTIPGTRRRVELEGARIFFPEERWAEFNHELRAHWQESSR